MNTHIKSVALTTAGVSALALDMANTLEHSDLMETFTETVNEHIDAKEVSGQTSLKLYEIIKTVFSTQQLVSMPFPDTKAEDVAGTTDNPDFYEIKTGEYNAKNIEKVEKGRHSHDFAEILPPGKAIRKDIEDVKAAIASKADEGNPYYRESTQRLTQLLNKFNSRLTTYRGTVKESLKIAKQMIAFEDIKGTVTVIISRDVIGRDADTHQPITEVSRGKTPIIVQEAIDPTKFKAMSPATFVALDVEKVIELGGTYDAVLKAIAKSNNNGGAPGNTGPKMAKDLNEVTDFANRITTFFDQLSEDGQKRIQNFVSLAGKKGGEEMAYALGELCLAMDNCVWPVVAATHARVAKEIAAKTGEKSQEPKQKAVA